LVILQSDVKYINLGNNNIDSLGQGQSPLLIIWRVIDPPIEKLSLNHNRLNNDDDAMRISQVLRRNMTLKRLDLDGE
jgi:hypothetical protein